MHTTRLFALPDANDCLDDFWKRVSVRAYGAHVLHTCGECMGAAKATCGSCFTVSAMMQSVGWGWVWQRSLCFLP